MIRRLTGQQNRLRPYATLLRWAGARLRPTSTIMLQSFLCSLWALPLVALMTWMASGLFLAMNSATFTICASHHSAGATGGRPPVPRLGPRVPLPIVPPALFYTEFMRSSLVKNFQYEVLSQNGPCTRVGGYIISDGGYKGADDDIVMPFQYVMPNSLQSSWTAQICSVRKDVECVFCILKSRFRVLHVRQLRRSVTDVGRLFKICAVIHNAVRDVNQSGVEQIREWAREAAEDDYGDVSIRGLEAVYEGIPETEQLNLELDIEPPEVDTITKPGRREELVKHWKYVRNNILR